MKNQALNCDSPVFNKSMMSADSALDFLLRAALVPSKTEVVGLDDALDRILSEDINSSINVPGFDNSAMDGYTIALDKGHTDKEGLSFSIVDRIPAGSIGNELKAGCAARIFTGAPIPKGANTVIMQEECQLSEDGSQITINRAINLNENVRPVGNDIVEGGVILQRGRQLQPQDISLAASVGVGQLEVFSKIKVGVFFTGDELVEPGNPLTAGKIYNSNRYALVALLKQVGCDIINLGNIEDKLQSTIDALSSLSGRCDLIMTTGGVSVGEEDHVKGAVESLGKLNLWKIRMKPGKPLAFGQVGKTAFIGLPGNPVSSFVTFAIFALPFIKKMQGNSEHQTNAIKVQANFDCERARPRREYARARLDYSTGSAQANLFPKQGSDVMSSIVWAHGIIEIPEDITFKAGELLNYYPLSELTR
ncbi:MAG: molybdopterin molybdotransferase MoeA [Gammaproteobacteria bacterium]|nr:molybdopterin molybdotransferase MoeA [Gammaproteobacteria bacterium]